MFIYTQFATCWARLQDHFGNWDWMNDAITFISQKNLPSFPPMVHVFPSSCLKLWGESSTDALHQKYRNYTICIYGVYKQFSTSYCYTLQIQKMKKRPFTVYGAILSLQESFLCSHSITSFMGTCTSRFRF